MMKSEQTQTDLISKRTGDDGPIILFRRELTTGDKIRRAFDYLFICATIVAVFTLPAFMSGLMALCCLPISLHLLHARREEKEAAAYWKERDAKQADTGAPSATYEKKSSNMLDPKNTITLVFSEPSTGVASPTRPDLPSVNVHFDTGTGTGTAKNTIH